MIYEIVYELGTLEIEAWSDAQAQERLEWLRPYLPFGDEAIVRRKSKWE